MKFRNLILAVALAISAIPALAQGVFPGPGRMYCANGVYYIGEQLTCTVNAGSAVALTTNVVSNICTITATPGTWRIEAGVGFSPAATTNVTLYGSGISLTSATLPPQDDNARFQTSHAAHVPGAGLGPRVSNPPRYLTAIVNTDVYFVGVTTHTVSTMGVYGKMTAHRIECP